MEQIVGAVKDECNDKPPNMAEDGEIVFIPRDEVFLLSVANPQLNLPLEADDATRCLAYLRSYHEYALPRAISVS